MKYVIHISVYIVRHREERKGTSNVFRFSGKGGVCFFESSRGTISFGVFLDNKLVWLSDKVARVFFQDASEGEKLFAVFLKIPLFGWVVSMDVIPI